MNPTSSASTELHPRDLEIDVLLLSTYELGRQPFGLASPAAWLRNAGARVTCADLSIEEFPAAVVGKADLVALFVPMHTATRLTAPLIPAFASSTRLRTSAVMASTDRRMRRT